MATGNPGVRYGFLGRLLLGVGITCFVVGSVFTIREALFLHNSLLAQGYYTDESGDTDSQGNTSFVYFVDFQDRNGKKVTFNAYTRNRELPEHKPFPIRYDPNNPSSARLADEPSPPLPMLLLTLGLGFGAVGGVLFRAEHQKRRAAFDAPALGT